MARAQDRNRFFSGKIGVKQSNKSIGLLGLKLHGRALEILKYLGAGNYANVVARMATVKCTKQNVSYWKNKFVAIGALRLQTRDVYQTFSLTPYGQKLLTRSEGSLREPRCLEDYAVKFEVLEWERRRIDWEKLGEPRNWEKLGCHVGGVRVVRTSSSVIIHPGPLKGFDDAELLMLSGRIVEWVRRVLEDKFGMLLSHEGVPLHKPITRFYTEEAKHDVQYGTVIVEGVGSIDASPPARLPHEEYVGAERARARLLLPDTVKRLELKVDELTKVTGNLADSMTKLVEFFKQFAGPEQQRPEVPGDFRYVR